MLDDKIIELCIEFDLVISLVRLFLKDECEIGLLFTNFHLNKIIVLQKVEFFQSFLKVMHSAKELRCNSDIFEWEIRIECVLGFICVQANYRLLCYSIICPSRIFRNLNLEEIVTNRIFKL